MEFAPDAIASFAATRPGSTKILLGVLRRLAAFVASTPGATVHDWIASQEISSQTAVTYRGIVASFARATGQEMPPRPKPPPFRRRTEAEKAARGVPLPEAEPHSSAPAPVEIPPPRVRLKPEFVAERTLQGHQPPAAMGDDFLATLATVVAERAGIGAIRAKLDEIAVALDLRPITRPYAERGPDVPIDVLRHQLTAVATALGVGPAAELLEIAPSGIERMLLGKGMPRIPDTVELDNAYVRLRWVQRDLAEDEDFEDFLGRMRTRARDDLDERAESRGASEGGH